MAELVEAKKHEHHLHQTHTVFGFWVYLMTDCILFGTLFATFAVLHNNTFGGPSGKDIIDLPYALMQTVILLISSFTSGLGMIGKRNSRKILFWFTITFMLGAAFIAMELTEFAHLVRKGYSWERSGYLTSYFTLVATHGTHITIGLIGMAILLPQVVIFGLTPHIIKRLTCLRLFWHFLDVVWIFIFTYVYLWGSIS